ncbi:MAG: YihY/virulence factor BrkB family protein [Bryobacteraceae bacterium]
MTAKAFWKLLRGSASKWRDCNAPRLGAALAFYLLLSLTPLLIFLVAIFGYAFSAATAQEKLLAEVHGVAGPAGEHAVRMLISNAAQPKSGLFASCLALATLLFGASGVFLELRESLNTIWSAPKRVSATLHSFVHQRLSSFAMVLGLAVVLMASLLLSTALAVLERFFVGIFPIHLAILSEVANLLISLLAISVLFALIFKYVPDVPIDWRDVGIGAVFTALLFTIGKTVLAIYFGTVGVGSTYGAAGSLVALIVWVYYSAQIFFFGAIFTHEYATKYGPRAIPRTSSLPATGQFKVRSQTA